VIALVGVVSPVLKLYPETALLGVIAPALPGFILELVAETPVASAAEVGVLV